MLFFLLLILNILLLFRNLFCGKKLLILYYRRHLSNKQKNWWNKQHAMLSLFLQEAVNGSRGGKIRLGVDATNAPKNGKSKFWLGAGDTNSSQLISEPPSDSSFVDSDSDVCKVSNLFYFFLKCI